MKDKERFAPTPVTEDGHVIGLPPAGPPPEDQAVMTDPLAPVIFDPPALSDDGHEGAWHL